MPNDRFELVSFTFLYCLAWHVFSHLHGCIASQLCWRLHFAFVGASLMGRGIRDVAAGVGPSKVQNDMFFPSLPLIGLPPPCTGCALHCDLQVSFGKRSPIDICLLWWESCLKNRKPDKPEFSSTWRLRGFIRFTPMFGWKKEGVPEEFFQQKICSQEVLPGLRHSAWNGLWERAGPSRDSRGPTRVGTFLSSK